MQNYEKIFVNKQKKKKKELDDSYKESVRQTKERKALDKKKKI